MNTTAVIRWRCYYYSLWILLLLFTIKINAQEFSVKTLPDELEKIFSHPPESAKPGVLWMWMGSNLSKEGITKDLEALKKQGFNRTTMFSLADVTTPWAGVIENSPTPELISWTEPWWKLVRYAAEESKRLGMDFGMFNGPGYESSGGVWISPELSMQEICWSKKNVKGGSDSAIELKKPTVPAKGHTPYPIFNGETGKVEIPEVAARKTYYKDIAVLAMPANGEIAKTDVIDITAAMQPGGKLDWKVPPGEWVIYRFGHTTTGTYIQPAQWKATGLECDKMSEEAVSFHMDHVITEIQKHLAGLVGTGFTHVHFDSYEAGYPTWTLKMKQEFFNRRGYSLISLLPNFADRRVGSQADSVQFKKDFDATIKDLHRDVYFKIIAEKLKAAHLDFLCEPYGGPWRAEEVMPLVQNVMTEFWTNKGNYSPYELEPTVAALRKSGQNLVEAEAFTGDAQDSRWSETPEWLKPIGDAAFCDGVNRMVIHRFVQQAFDDRYKPGATMGRWGTHMDRTQTWWKPGKAMIEYWQRCQALLQWGRFAASGSGHFKLTNVTDSITIKHIRRKQNETELYFLANISRRKGAAVCSFKITGMQPELWDAVTGEMQPITAFNTDDQYTSFSLNFDMAQSYFIVFRHRLTSTTAAATKDHRQVEKEILQLTGSWKVKFDSVWGGPSMPVVFTQLQDWTSRPEEGIKYFSGTALYTKSFDLPFPLQQKKGETIYLDLGTVNHIASIKLNDNNLGVVWTAPWRIKIPLGILKSKGNQLEIEITNVWANRLIGDEQQPPDCEWIPGYLDKGMSLKAFPNWFLKKQPRPSKGRFCFTTWNYFDKDSPLIPSGLLGPVRMIKSE